MKREIVLDTETTGFKPTEGHKLVEIGCVELINHIPSGEIFHCYINPERDMPTGAFEVHGLSEEFLRPHKIFKEVAQDFLEFIKDDPLIIHNAAFDMGFLNFELEAVGLQSITHNTVIDTLKMARKKFPGSPASLDALCRRFKVDNTARTKHGAIIDCELLAAVYLELIGGRQVGMDLSKEEKKEEKVFVPQGPKKTWDKRIFSLSEQEKALHDVFISEYISKKNT